MIACTDAQTVSLYTASLTTQYVMKKVLFLTGIENNDASLMSYSSDQSIIFFTKSYAWRTQSLTFIDSILVLKSSSLEEPNVIGFKKDIFYDMHADETSSMDQHGGSSA